MSDRRERLVAGHGDGSLTGAEQAELLEALRADPGLLDVLVAEVELHRSLQLWTLRSGDADHRAARRVVHFVRSSHEGPSFAEVVKRRAVRSVPRRGGSSWGPALLAAGLLLAILAGYGVTRPVRPASRPVAERRPAPEEIRKVEEDRPVAPPKPDQGSRRAEIEAEIRRTIAETEARHRAAREQVAKVPAVEEIPKREEPVPAIARLEGAAGRDLRAGERVEGRAVVRLADGTRLELEDGGAIAVPSARAVAVERGTCSAEVAKQPPGYAVVFTTPHAEVRVLGTKLSIRVESGLTRVDVTEGRVRVSKGAQAVVLAAGQGAEVGATGAPRSHLLGLRARYWDQNTFKGPALVDRVEPGIGLALDENEPAPVGSDHDFGARWEGRFLAEREGEYAFILGVDGHAKLSVDGAVLAEDKPAYFHGFTSTVIRRRLSAGWHDLAVAYGDDDQKSRCSLRFLPPGARPAEGDEALQRNDSGLPIPARLFSHRN